MYIRNASCHWGSETIWGSFLGFQVHAFPQPLKFLASSGIICIPRESWPDPVPWLYCLCSASRKQPGTQEGEPGIRAPTLLASACLGQLWLHGLPSWQEGCGGQSGCLCYVGAWKQVDCPQEHMDASEPLMFLGAANQSNPEPLDFGRFSGWLRELICSGTEWAGRTPSGLYSLSFCCQLEQSREGVLRTCGNGSL